MVTIICVGGWKYIGNLEDITHSPMGKLHWIKLSTKKGTVKINGDHVVAILEYADNTTNRKKTS